MKPEEFQPQMNRLSSRWKGIYVDELVRLIWREVEPFHARWLERTVDKFLGECRQAPLLPEFREEISRERERSGAGAQRREQGFHSAGAGCGYCRDSGVVVAVKEGEVGPYAFRCSCARGSADPRRQIPQFGPSHQGLVVVDPRTRKPVSA